MVPQFILEVHRPYRRKVREPDDPPGDPDGRVLRAVRRSPRKGSGVQGERGPAHHPGLARILPRVQLDISGRVRPVLGTRGLKPTASLLPWVVGLTPKCAIVPYGSSRLRRDSRSARQSSAFRLKLDFADRLNASMDSNSWGSGRVPSKSEITNGPSPLPSPSRKLR